MSGRERGVRTGCGERRDVVELESLVIYCSRLVWDLIGCAALMIEDNACSAGLEGEVQVGAPHMHGSGVGRWCLVKSIVTR